MFEPVGQFDQGRAAQQAHPLGGAGAEQLIRLGQVALQPLLHGLHEGVNGQIAQLRFETIEMIDGKHHQRGSVLGAQAFHRLGQGLAARGHAGGIVHDGSVCGGAHDHVQARGALELAAAEREAQRGRWPGAAQGAFQHGVGCVPAAHVAIQPLEVRLHPGVVFRGNEVHQRTADEVIVHRCTHQALQRLVGFDDDALLNAHDRVRGFGHQHRMAALELLQADAQPAQFAQIEVMLKLRDDFELKVAQGRRGIAGNQGAGTLPQGGLDPRVRVLAGPVQYGGVGRPLVAMRDYGGQHAGVEAAVDQKNVRRLPL